MPDSGARNTRCAVSLMSVLSVWDESVPGSARV
jgi:hypothetical protein